MKSGWYLKFDPFREDEDRQWTALGPKGRLGPDTIVHDAIGQILQSTGWADVDLSLNRDLSGNRVLFLTATEAQHAEG